jgi:PAS domain S-box-containing protein
MNRLFDHRLVIGLGVIVALLVVNAAVAYRNTRQLHGNAYHVARAHDVLESLDRLLSTMQDAETGQRGFLITGDERYLKPYEDARAALEGNMQRLERITAGQPAQITRLQGLIRAKMDELRRTIALRKNEGADAARKEVLSHLGINTMDAIRASIAAIRADEQRILSELQEASDRAYRGSLFGGALAFLMGLAAVGGFVEVLRRHLETRRSAAAVLHEERERFRTTLMSIGDAVIATDAEGRVTLLNPVAQALTGWNDDARGKPLDTVFRIENEESRQPAENPARRALREGTIVGLANHTILVARDGTERAIDDSAAPIRDEKGNVSGVVLVFRDVTEYRRADQAARFLASLVDSSDDAIVGKDHSGIITSWNQGAERLFGYPASEALGRPIAMLAPPDRRDEMPGILEQIRRGQRVEHFETVRRARDGRLVPISLTVSPIRNGEGTIVGASKIARDISQRRAAEAALHEEKERLHATLVSIGDAVIVTDAAGLITLMNPVAQSLTGWKEEAIGRPLEEVFRIVNEQTGQPAESPVGRVLREGTVVGLANHTVLVARDGTRTPIEDSAAPIRRQAGEIAGVVLVFRSAAERRAVELAATRHRDILELVHRIGKIGHWEWNSLTDDNIWSAEIEALYGLPPGGFKGGYRGWAELVHPDDLLRAEEDVRRALETGKYSSEFRVVWPDGSVHWLEARANVLKDGHDRPVRIVGVNMDVTDRKQAEAALQTHSDRLQLLWEAAALMLSSAEPDAMLRELFAGIAPQFELDAYFNFVVTETGDALRLASCVGIPDEVAARISRLEFGQAICGTVALERRSIVATHIQQSGDPKAQLARSLGIRAYACNPLQTSKELFGTLSFASRTRDEFDPGTLEFLATISAYVAVALERLRLVRELRDADRRKDEFLATLAHELRNPLAPIRNAVALLSRSDGDVEAVEQARSVIERQADQMVRLIDDLLDISRISQGKVPLRKERVELAAVVQSAIEAVRPLLEVHGHELTVTLPPGPVWLDADPTRLAQVISNLLNNAAKYTEKGGHIWLIAEQRGGEVVVAIRDTGIGIAAEHLPHIFDMFSQVAPALERSQGGLGIGLALVRGLVELHGGSVDARSGGVGKGCEFIVRLPTADVPVTAAPEKPTHRRAETGGRKCRVLAVDDNRDSADMLARVLKMMGHETRTAYDGLEAVQAAAAFRPDVVLLDIGLPKMNGYEAARQIRTQPSGKAAVLIALTGWGQEQDRSRALEAGFDQHLTKPVDPIALERILGLIVPRS